MIYALNPKNNTNYIIKNKKIKENIENSLETKFLNF